MEWLEASSRRLLPVLTPESYRLAAMLGCIVSEPRPGAFNRSPRAFETLDEATA
ncbi:MAG: hypothetical protein AB1492_06560 [Bacillota bacterium]